MKLIDQIQRRVLGAAHLLMAENMGADGAAVFFDELTAVWFFQEDGACAPIAPFQIRRILAKQIAALSDDELRRITLRAAGWMVNEHRVLSDLSAPMSELN